MALGLTLPAITFAEDRPQPPDGGDRPPRHEGGPQGEGRQMPPPPPVIGVLDANHDGVIDEVEIAQAAESLKKLDKNGDGKLTIEELRPPRPEDAPEDGPRHRPPPPEDKP